MPNQQVLNTCGAANIHLHNIGKIRRFIDPETTNLLVHSYVAPKLDNCNSLINGSGNIHSLQLIQNRAARIITSTKPKDHITPVLQPLHWLLIQTVTNKTNKIQDFFCEDDFPIYIRELLNEYQPSRSLRSERSR
ncbi:uncharacterized protein [Haliotis asinina]|uniref:uncharacterized protein n=1 Tax=Haliotis asinina TaxID=109174 RepID=UPI0035326058